MRSLGKLVCVALLLAGCPPLGSMSSKATEPKPPESSSESPRETTDVRTGEAIPEPEAAIVDRVAEHPSGGSVVVGDGACPVGDVTGAWRVKVVLPRSGPTAFTIDLRPDGSTSHRDYEQGGSTDPGPWTNPGDTWTSDHGTVTFSINNKFATYVGRCPQGSSMSGNASNGSNDKWSFAAERTR